MRKTFLISLLLLSVLPSFAQKRVMVSGTVTDSEGLPLEGVTIVVKNDKTVYALTASGGAYSIEAPEDAVLVFQLLGYLSCEVALESRKDYGRTDVVMEEDLMNLEAVVVTGTRTPRLLKDSPILTRVITSADIKRVDALDVGDLLEAELPGIEFSYAMDQQVTLNMQGFGGNSVLFLVDGERIAGETLDNIDYSRLNLDNVERVEIIKGAASSLYGSNAVGGVVNIITSGATEPWSVNVNARYGAHNERRYGGSAGFVAGKFNSMTNVQYTAVDSYKMKNEGDYNAFYGGFNYSVKERLQYEPVEGLKFTARAGYFFRERDMQADTKDRYRDFSGGLKGEWDINDENRVELSYSYDQYDKSDYLLFNDSDVRDYSNVQHVLRGIYTYSFFPGGHTLIVGGDYMRDYLMSYQFEGNGHYIQHTADVFTQIECNLDDRWHLTGGLRFDYFSQKKLSHFSPKLSLMYRIGGWSFRGSYSGGFRAPTLKEMYMSFDMAGIFMIYGNPDLAPESSENLSLSAEYSWKYLNVSLSGFYNWVDNRITTVWNDALGGMQYMNMSPLQVRGLDFSVSTRLPFGLGARLSYTYTDEAIRAGEPLLSQTRPHSATLKVEYGKSWKNYGFNIALSGRVLSAVTTDVYTSATDYEDTETVTYPGYTIWKLVFSQDIWRGIDLNVIVDNLFNYVPDYYYSSSPATTGITAAVGLSVDIEKFFKKY
ncbi:MAG: TonB-dependent receptor [Bacteroidetes bacterium]|uniref:TonB-dependent receptor n=1 Tax=Candidatus Merdivivens pullistercoris TaxID=2840873 RepID=A0A9D9N8H1_9BACT|nr:TonB-dependent receptor [Candidatus Merdivivens pullistercoris]